MLVKVNILLKCINSISYGLVHDKKLHLLFGKQVQSYQKKEL